MLVNSQISFNSVGEQRKREAPTVSYSSSLSRPQLFSLHHTLYGHTHESEKREHLTAMVFRFSFTAEFFQTEEKPQVCFLDEKLGGSSEPAP